jgi:peptide chain release factor 3
MSIPDDIAREAARRRTFAIISHPDAGKTTLTEKLLLYSGAIHLAGSVRSRKTSRHAVSDWMAMEQERGISITSSVLQFEYRDRALNLLDTPGHADFSEDTYRTLAAVDSATMLIDHTKGIESRTLKLFEVCRMRELPIITFMNKLDRPGRDPLELIDELAATLNLAVAPINWPIGMGREFVGVVDLATRIVSVYSGGDHGQSQLAVESLPLEAIADRLGATAFAELKEQLDLLDVAGESWDPVRFRKGELTPVFWGSAMTNFGVEPLLSFLVDNTSPPAIRGAIDKNGEEIIVEPTDERFSGFVFKVQANMNPRHRDRVAFLRVVSGHFERGMDVVLGRTGEKIRLSKPHTFMAQERSIVEEAWPGDIVGLYDPGKLRVGDTVATGAPIQFEGYPDSPPSFSRVSRSKTRSNASTSTTVCDNSRTRAWSRSSSGPMSASKTPGWARSDCFSSRCSNNGCKTSTASRRISSCSRSNWRAGSRARPRLWPGSSPDANTRSLSTDTTDRSYWPRHPGCSATQRRTPPG